MLLFLLVQIISESLPISSSGHVQLLRCIYKLYGIEYLWLPGLEEYVHCYSLLLFIAVLSPYWFVLIRHPLRTAAQWKQLILCGFCAELCSTLSYVPLYMVKEYIPLWVGFLCSALLLLLLPLFGYIYDRDHYCALSMKSLCLIGFAQGLAAIPGLSRMGITYVMGRLLGASPRHAFAWSCTLALPVFFVGVAKGYLLMTEQSISFLLQPGVQLVLFMSMLCAAVMLYITKKMVSSGTVSYLGTYMLFIAFISWIFC